MIIHLDDYVHNDGAMTIDLFKLIHWMDHTVEFKIYALMAGCIPDDILHVEHLLGVEIGLHGWNHFIEPAFGYWQARHLLETAKSWGCFSSKFKMPWNRMPRLGFLRALRETGFTLVTPYKWQAVVARAVGVTVEWSDPDYLLHPLDLSSNSYQLQKLKEELTQ